MRKKDPNSGNESYKKAVSFSFFFLLNKCFGLFLFFLSFKLYVLYFWAFSFVFKLFLIIKWKIKKEKNIYNRGYIGCCFEKIKNLNDFKTSTLLWWDKKIVLKKIIQQLTTYFCLHWDINFNFMQSIFFIIKIMEQIQ